MVAQGGTPCPSVSSCYHVYYEMFIFELEFYGRWHEVAHDLHDGSEATSVLFLGQGFWERKSRDFPRPPTRELRGKGVMLS